MTYITHFFITYTPCPSNRKIVAADGSMATVVGVGDIYIAPIFTLKDVLHVLKLSANLVSIKRLNNDLKCYVMFYPTYYVFQE